MTNKYDKGYMRGVFDTLFTYGKCGKCGETYIVGGSEVVVNDKGLVIDGDLSINYDTIYSINREGDRISISYCAQHRLVL